MNPHLHTRIRISKYAKRRRDALRALGLCINSTLPGSRRSGRLPTVVHGEPVKAGKCARCYAVHQRSR